MNLANQLTVLRILLALGVFAALMDARPASHLAASVMFLTAIITDWVDGYVARRMKTISAFGQILDPIADKILVLGTFIALSKHKTLLIPVWGIFAIVARELLIGGLRMLCAIQGKVLAAEKWGKWKMAVQSVSVLLMLFILVAAEHLPALPAWLTLAPYPLTVLCVIVAWSSLWYYFRQSRKLIENSWA